VFAKASRSSTDSPEAEVSLATDELWCDLDAGRWEERNASLLDEPELDVGLRLVVAA
jgi:hypothetical protein